MKVKIKNGCLVIRIPLGELPFDQVMVDGGAIAMPKGPKPKPAEVEHTPECVQLRAQEFIFTKTWPVHCRTCSAKGYIVNSQTKQKITCPRCLEFGICSRCGNSALAKMSDESGTYYRCTNEECQWSQRDAFNPSAEVAGLIAPVWRCNCATEEPFKEGF